MNMYNSEKGFFSEAFLKSLFKAQTSSISLPSGKEDFDVYLAKSLYPSLIPGLESLAESVERIMNDDNNAIDQSIKDRFNPCIFLAEFLMRHQPQQSKAC